MRPTLVADRADHGMQQPADAEARGEQLLLHRVDEERRVVGVRLHHRADRLVPVGDRSSGSNTRTVEGCVPRSSAKSKADRTRPKSASTPDSCELLGREPPQERLRERVETASRRSGSTGVRSARATPASLRRASPGVGTAAISECASTSAHSPRSLAPWRRLRRPNRPAPMRLDGPPNRDPAGDAQAAEITRAACSP